MTIAHYDKVALLLPMDGANNGTVFTDWGPAARTVTRSGDAKTLTAQSKFYGSSGFFDGSGDRITGSLPQIGTQDFCIEFWYRPVSPNGGQDFARLFALGANATNGSLYIVKRSAGSAPANFFVQVYSGGSYSDPIGFSATTGQPIALDSWTHVAICREGTTYRVFIGGVLAATNSHAPGANITQTAFHVGSNSQNGESLHAYLQDLLVTIGAVKYTSNFTPPARLVGEISGVIRDDTGALAERRIVAFPRSYPARVFETTSDDTTGAYSLRVPATECSRVVLAEDVSDPLYNDLIDRVMAA